MEAYILRRAQWIKKLAIQNGFEYLGSNEPNFMVSFTNGECKINVWLTTLTVGTALDHPFKGKTQLIRKDLSKFEIERIFRNPRVHTKKGYYKK